MTVANRGAAKLALFFYKPTSAAAAPLQVQSADAVRDVRWVVIGAFNVGFIFDSVDYTKASGGMVGAFGGRTGP